MSSVIDIAWLAGVFDGEGCVQVSRSVRKNTAPPSVVLTITNTSALLVERVVETLRTLGVKPFVYYTKPKKTRAYCQVRVSRKRDVLVVAEVLEQYATAKREELRIAITYLKKSCQVRQYKVTDEDVAALESMSEIKRRETLKH